MELHDKVMLSLLRDEEATSMGGKTVEDKTPKFWEMQVFKKIANHKKYFEQMIYNKIHNICSLNGKTVCLLEHVLFINQALCPVDKQTFSCIVLRSQLLVFV